MYFPPEAPCYCMVNLWSQSQRNPGAPGQKHLHSLAPYKNRSTLLGGAGYLHLYGVPPLLHSYCKDSLRNVNPLLQPETSVLHYHGSPSAWTPCQEMKTQFLCPPHPKDILAHRTGDLDNDINEQVYVSLRSFLNIRPFDQKLSDWDILSLS